MGTGRVCGLGVGSLRLPVLLPPTDALRIRRGDPSIDVRALAARIAGASWSNADVIKATDRVTVLRAMLDTGERVVIKVTPADGLGEALKGAVRRARLDRAWAGAMWLRAHGFHSPRPRALVSGLREGARLHVLVVEEVPGSTLLALARSGGLQIDAAREPVGRMLGRLIAMGRVNADSKPSNLVVDPPRKGDPEPPRVHIVDTGALRRIGVRGKGWALVRMLRDLSLEPMGVGSALSRGWVSDVAAWALKERLGASPSKAAVAAIVRRVERAVAAHGDPTPRDLPRE